MDSEVHPVIWVLIGAGLTTVVGGLIIAGIRKCKEYKEDFFHMLRYRTATQIDEHWKIVSMRNNITGLLTSVDTLTNRVQALEVQGRKK